MMIDEKRDEKGRFKKGFSGRQGTNAGSRRLMHVSILARQHTEDAIRVLAEIMMDQKADPAPRTRAAEALLNRAWGRPPEDLTFRVAENSGELKIRWLSDDDPE
jgi:hypothetical protein